MGSVFPQHLLHPRVVSLHLLQRLRTSCVSLLLKHVFNIRAYLTEKLKWERKKTLELLNNETLDLTPAPTKKTTIIFAKCDEKNPFLQASL